MLIDILLTLFLVLLNGFFVAAEFALVKVRSSQLEVRASEGEKTASLTLSMIKHLDSYLSACQLGITLASLALGWIGEKVVAGLIINLLTQTGYQFSASLIHDVSLVIAFILITTLHIVLGEQAPKSFAIHQAEKVSMAVSYPLRVFYTVFKPFIFGLNWLSNVVIKLMGLSKASEHDQHSAEELELLIDQGKVSGAIQPGEHELIKNVFNFNQIMAKQIMTPRTSINAIDIESDPEEVLDKVVQEGYSRLPVYKDSIDDIVGILYTKDLLRKMRDTDDVEVNIQDILRQPVYIPEIKRISELLKELQEKHLHMAIVMDEFGGVAGLVTIEDIIEELVGEIQDEHDDEAPIVEKLGDQEYVLNALCSIEDINEFLPEPITVGTDYDTVSGYMAKLFGKIPDVNEKIKDASYEYLILKKSKRNVMVVKALLLGDQESSTDH
jgi:CBS domain containing-hemolysin-like protein